MKQLSILSGLALGALFAGLADNVGNNGVTFLIMRLRNSLNSR